MRLLIQAGGAATVAMRNDDGNTALHLASSAGNLSMCQLLISAKAGLDIAGEDGDTPLHLASYYGHADVCACLVAAGCNLHTQNRHGLSAGDYGVGHRSSLKT
jgi:hypothetical protein